MKSIKTHFGVIFSLVALLFSVQFGICADFKFGERAVELKADFLSRFLTRGAE